MSNTPYFDEYEQRRERNRINSNATRRFGVATLNTAAVGSTNFVTTTSGSFIIQTPQYRLRKEYGFDGRLIDVSLEFQPYPNGPWGATEVVVNE